MLTSTTCDRQAIWLFNLDVGGFKVCPDHDMEALKDIRVLLFYLVGHVAFCQTSVKYIGT